MTFASLPRIASAAGIVPAGRLSPALLGSALLFTLAFGCGLASNWISNQSNSTIASPEVSMEATMNTRATKLVTMTVWTLLGTVAEVAAGIATSG
jgi:hypothetical protein